MNGSPQLGSGRDIDTFASMVNQVTLVDDYPLADRVEQNVLVYDAEELRLAGLLTDTSVQLAPELIRALMSGPGIAVFANAFVDHEIVDRVTAAFNSIVAGEAVSGRAAGDHFAAPGANSRVWNALEKVALRDPEAFVAYYSNDVLATVSRAWLGPAYQVTSQVNIVRPSGKAQEPHRDYHLGFLSNEVVSQFPEHVQRFSAQLTLQGAVAHCDMPVESGPTMYLPYSQQYVPGYLAWRLPAFKEYFAQHHVQLPLAKGDAVFFNPAVFHGAGTNVSSNIQRVANLLQVSSAFGRPMEHVDRTAIVKAIYPVLCERLAREYTSALTNVMAVAAHGYPFPTNLDVDQPVDGPTPRSQMELLQCALAENWDEHRLHCALDDYDSCRGQRLSTLGDSVSETTV